MTIMDSNSAVAEPRRIFMILSPRSLVYAKHALESLLSNALEPLRVHLITDAPSDKELLLEKTASYQKGNIHSCAVFAKSDLDDQEAAIFRGYPNLRRFRHGHPCWRKITDPLLLGRVGDEIVVLDPDLYFPNKFCFEATPDEGLLLMWQRPNCLFPATIVGAALQSRIALAHHVDIGVAHWRGQVDLDWLEWLLVQLRIGDHPNARFTMHIEAIVWAAIAMREGGGYLPPEHWHCWRRSQRVRLLRKLRVPGPHLIRSQPFSTIKCFHAGGEAKYWLQGAKERAWLDSDNVLDQQGTILPFVELTPSTYRRDQAVKSWLRRFGYYSLFPSGALQ
jgi:hypothetical protein